MANRLTACFVAAVLAVGGSAAWIITRTTTPPATTTGPVCGDKYDRVVDFGNSPTKKARAAALRAATVDGRIIDFYTGLPLAVGVPVDLDHVLALATAWPVACGWTPERRREFANAETALRPTTANINRSKGDRTPAQWSPVDRGHSCEYGTLYLKVAHDWELERVVSDADRAAVASACGGS